MITAKAERLIQNYFQFPNTIVDDLLADMSGAELKCYLLIVRKTRGWQKISDSISISQFIEATGLSNRGVIDACDALIKRGLITKSTGQRGVSVYSLDQQLLTCEKSSPVRKSHSTCEKSSQVTCEKSSHTKDTIKNTIQNTTTTTERDAERAAKSPELTGNNRIPNQPKPQEQIIMSVTWEPSSGFGARLVRAGKKPDLLTKELFAKFCAYYDGQERRQSQWEAELLAWVCREIPEAQKPPKSKPAKSGGVKNKYVNINDRDYGESGSF